MGTGENYAITLPNILRSADQHELKFTRHSKPKGLAPGALKLRELRSRKSSKVFFPSIRILAATAHDPHDHDRVSTLTMAWEGRRE